MPFKELQVTPEDVYRKPEQEKRPIQVPEEGETLPDRNLILEDDLPLEDWGMVRRFRWRFGTETG